MRSVTGLSIKGFESLVPKFSKALCEIQFHHYEAGIQTGTRKREAGRRRQREIEDNQAEVIFYPHVLQGISDHGCYGFVRRHGSRKRQASD